MLNVDVEFSENAKDVVKELVEKKISEFGFFTSDRKFNMTDIVVPFGASEMLMYSLREKVVDAAVVVCDGAGSVIATDPEIVQGIGARMNGLFFTSPIAEVKKKLKDKNCNVLFEDASIDQVDAVKKACELGYKNIAVTINGYVENESLFQIKYFEDKYSVRITLLIICTTGAGDARIQEIAKYADVVWSCASQGIRTVVGKESILQISNKIPVFVLTQKGLDFISAYSANKKILRSLCKNKQYLISRSNKGEKIIMGKSFMYRLSESKLPVRSKSEPRF